MTTQGSYDTPWPSIEQYALAHRCPRCKANPGEPCIIRPGRGTIHQPRQDAGIRHYDRDVVRAPEQEDRVPGQRYDTLC